MGNHDAGLAIGLAAEMANEDLSKLKRVAEAAAIAPYCGDKDGLKKIMDGRVREFQSTFTPDVVLSLLLKIEACGINPQAQRKGRKTK